MTHHTKLQLVTKAHAATRTLLVALALTAACTDDSLTTGPQLVPAIGESSRYSASSKGAGGVVVTRTVSYRARDTHAKAPTRLTESFTLALTGDAPAAMSWPGATGVNDTIPTYQRMTLGTISVPARAASEVCSNGKDWKSDEKGGRGMSIKMEGRDDLPYTRLDVLQDGKVIGTYTSHWKRLRDRWILTSREFETFDKSIVEKIDIDHRAALGKSAALPARHCDAERANVIAGTDLVSGSAPGFANGKAAPCVENDAGLARTPGVLNERGDDTSYDSGEVCYAKRMAIYKAEALLAAASTTMALTCTPGMGIPLVGPPLAAACLVATIGYAVAIADLSIARANYTDCLEEQERLKRDAPPAGGSPPPTGGPVIPPTDTPTKVCYPGITGWQEITWSDGTVRHIDEIGEVCSYT